VYEWENGVRSLISDGRSSLGAGLGGTTPSGNDVFFTTDAQLVPQDSDGFDDIYDARVGGGFPSSGPGPGACQSAESCRSAIAPTAFFPVPGSSTLISPPTITPAFTVNSISAKQRANFAKTGKLTLTVRANAGGRIGATASAKLKSGLTQMSSATKTLFSPTGGKVTLKLSLNRAGRTALATSHKLKVTVEVSYSQSSVNNVATMTLTSKKAKRHNKRHKRHTTAHHGRRGA